MIAELEIYYKPTVVDSKRKLVISEQPEEVYSEIVQSSDLPVIEEVYEDYGRKPHLLREEELLSPHDFFQTSDIVLERTEEQLEPQFWKSVVEESHPEEVELINMAEAPSEEVREHDFVSVKTKADKEPLVSPRVVQEEMDIATRLKTEASLPEEYISYGKKGEVEILRYEHQNGELSGILFKSDGCLITAKHVVEAHNLPGFQFVEGYDLAFKNDPNIKGPKLGYVTDMMIDGVKVITSTAEKPDDIIAVPGRIGFSLRLITLSPFYPRNPEDIKLFRPGASGSPMIYKDHIVGLIPVIYNEEMVQNVGAFLFRGSSMKDYMGRQGLTLEEVK